jgi:hypothetical protein
MTESSNVPPPPPPGSSPSNKPGSVNKDEDKFKGHLTNSNDGKTHYFLGMAMTDQQFKKALNQAVQPVIAQVKKDQEKMHKDMEKLKKQAQGDDED